MYRNLICFLLLASCFPAQAQIRISGKIINAKLEPLMAVSVQVKGSVQGTFSAEDGRYELELEEGMYEIVFSMIGYKPQVHKIILKESNYEQNIVMEADEGHTLTSVTVKSKDKAEEYIRRVIQNKDNIEKAAGEYSCTVYIKAIQEDSVGAKKSKKPVPDSIQQKLQANRELNHMAMAEIVLRLDRGYGKRVKEERTGVTKRGNTGSLFFLTTTEANINFYNNPINIPSISQTAFVSPVSYSGLVAYRYRTLRTETKNGRKYFTISVKPKQLSNATVEGEITIFDSSWAIVHTKFRLPSYHLAEYDFFEVEQHYSWINNQAWMITRQEFSYRAISSKMKATGKTVATYSNFELNREFDRKHFGAELSSATEEAYKRDSNFWQSNRTEPLTDREVRYIHFKDSLYQATHTKAYLDSLDKMTNKLTWKNLLINGQSLNNHKKRRSMRFPAIPELIQPFQVGGMRIEPSYVYSKTFESRKTLFIQSFFSYGFRNKDFNGSINLMRMYNPFNRGYFTLRLQKDFAYIFSGDAWINMIQRSNYYLDQSFGIGHGLEIANGLFVYSDFDIAFRRSIVNYKTEDRIDSLFGDILDNNQAVAFDAYNATYGMLRLEYTPKQRYIREPKEKVILGSAWPTFYVHWRKGLPRLFNSKVDFDFLELGMRQSVKLGAMGVSTYSLKTGSFPSQRDLRLIDYKYQRRGDPILFLNPGEAFQALDSSFATFKRFYEGHYLHEFNGALLNKIPLFKKIGLREIAGGGFLIASERNLRYAEMFTGVERVFKYPFKLLGKFKLGVYVVGSVANQFSNPIQFKIGITTWDRKRGKWF